MIAYEELMCHSPCSTRWASLRIRRGMTVSQALQVSGDWTWGFAYSERRSRAARPISLWSPRHLPGRRPTPTLRIPGRSSPSRQPANDRPPVAHVADLSGSDALQFRSLLSTHKARYNASRASGLRSSWRNIAITLTTQREAALGE